MQHSPKRLIDAVASPAQLKKLSVNQLPELAKEIRAIIIETVSQTGGHLASSLGVVELTLALHYVLDSPRDSIVWDVGHQAYTHKIITGRLPQFHTLRQFQGLSGFCKREESVHDIFNAGHASTALSAAVGIAEARKQKSKPGSVYAVVGDAALAGGMAFEALNQLGHLQSNVRIILNDNEMSISESVGAFSKYLNNVISGKMYNAFKRNVEQAIAVIPGVGKQLLKFTHVIEEGIKGFFIPGVLFEELGIRYLGPFNGHDTQKLISVLQNVRDYSGPLLLHVVTKKGKGIRAAEEDPTKFHGVSPKKKVAADDEKMSYSAAAAKTVTELAKTNSRITVVTAAMCAGTGFSMFQQKFPKRIFDVGICEEHAVTFAAGLAVEQMRPIVAIYSTFLQRGYDQIIHDVCLQNLPVVFLVDRAGIVGADGPTHHGVFDLSYLLHIPNMNVFAPANAQELASMIAHAVSGNQPVAIRYPRGSVHAASLPVTDITGPQKVASGDAATIVAVGTMLHNVSAIEDCDIFNVRCLKPDNFDEIYASARRTGRLVTVEDNVIRGGFGEYLAMRLRSAGSKVSARTLGWPDEFIPQGTRSDLEAQYGLDAAGIRAAVHAVGS